MKQSISVPFSINDKEVEIVLFYNTDFEDNNHIINCKVDVDSFDSKLWQWLGVRTFKFISKMFDGGYAQLYVENDNVNSTEAILFMECAYNRIMAKERLPIATID